MKMVNLGKKDSRMTLPRNQINYPSFSIVGSDKIPKEIQDGKVGDSFRCEVLVKKMSQEISTWDKNQPRISLEIRNLGYLGQENDNKTLAQKVIKKRSL